MARVKIGNVRTPLDYLKEFFAPTGFGLGAKGKMLSSTDDLNTIWQSGWYRWGESVPANAPVFLNNNKYSYMRVDGADEKTYTQTAYSVFGDAKGIFMTRNITENVVDDWKFINPPMKVGVEYRTTEWWKGKTVYTKLIDFGASANGRSIVHELNPGTIIRYSAVAGSIPLPHFNTVETEYQISVSVGATNITMVCGESRTGLQTYVQVWYIKD